MGDLKLRGSENIMVSVFLNSDKALPPSVMWSVLDKTKSLVGGMEPGFVILGFLPAWPLACRICRRASASRLEVLGLL